MDCYDEGEHQNSISVKCMPSAYPAAINAIDSIFKALSQSHFESRLNRFVCDFLQDENGCFYFLKIHDFSAAPVQPYENPGWKVSTRFVDRIKQKEDELVQSQVCQAQIICTDNKLKILLMFIFI